MPTHPDKKKKTRAKKVKLKGMAGKAQSALQGRQAQLDANEKAQGL